MNFNIQDVANVAVAAEAAAGFEPDEMELDLWCRVQRFHGSTEHCETKPMLTRNQSESAERQAEQCDVSDAT